MTRARRTIVSIVFFGIMAAAGAAVVRRQNAGPQLAAVTHGGKGPPTIVLLHGYGSSADHWTPFARTIRIPPHGRFVFPQGPESTVPPDGPAGGHAWWKLDLFSSIPSGRSMPDLSKAAPAGIRTAAALVERLISTLQVSPGGAIVLGGFSQGAMVASEIAFSSNTAIAALVILSGTLVDEKTWQQNFARRRGLPIFMAHGRTDDVLPFEIADRFRTKLESAGLPVTWCPFDGGHDIPAEVVVALNGFLARLRLTS